MGRKKIKIEKISQPKNRQVTFNKRKVGLMKKAMELSILMNIDSIWQRYLEYDGPYESLSNDDLDLLKPGKASSFKVGTRKRKRPVGGVMVNPQFGEDDDEGDEDEDEDDVQTLPTTRRTKTRGSVGVSVPASSKSNASTASSSSSNSSQPPMAGAAALMAAAQAESLQSMDSVTLLGQAMAAAHGSSSLLSPGMSFPHGLAFQSPPQVRLPPNLLGKRSKFTKTNLTVQIPPKKGMSMLEVGDQGGSTGATPVRSKKNGGSSPGGSHTQHDGQHSPLLTPSSGRMGSLDYLEGRPGSSVKKEGSIGNIGSIGTLNATHTQGHGLQSPSSFFSLQHDSLKDGGGLSSNPFGNSGFGVMSGGGHGSLMTPMSGSTLSPFAWGSGTGPLQGNHEGTRRSPLNSGSTALRSPSAQALLSRSFGNERSEESDRKVKSEFQDK